MESLLALLKPLEGYAPLASALLTLVIAWRFLDQKAAVQLSAREAKIREFLTAELDELKLELAACEKAKNEAQKRITHLETQVRELIWDRGHQRGEP